MHEYALRNMAITVAWVLPNDELLRSLAPREEVGGKRGEQQRDP